MIRALLLVAAVSGLWAAAVAASGGFDLRVAGVSIRSHSAMPALVVCLLCFGGAFFRGVAGVRDAIAWWWLTVERRAAVFAAATAVAAIATGAIWGTHAAGGPDSYCYLNQAEIFARGDVRELQPIASRAPWPDRAAPFVPIGHVPSPGPEGAIVPMCAAGYPLLMAAARTIGGRPAMFWIVPIMGGLAVWLTFLLGRRVAGPIEGLFGAVLLATSPAFLYQIVQPMTDVPAVALWTLALLVATRRSPLLAGLATGAAVLVRPNLVPLAAVIWGQISIFSLREDRDLTPASLTAASWLRSTVLFGLGVLPFVLAVMAFQNAMYGGPLKSGYGDLGSLFALDHIVPNLRGYSGWLVRTETPLIIAALFGPLVIAKPFRRVAWALLVFAAATFACYLPYVVFDAWWYLRFVLPAFPPLLVLESAILLAAFRRFPVPTRALATVAIALVLVAFHLTKAVDGSAFRLREFESRFREGGEYVAQRLPANAAVVTVWQSGSVRFYSGRLTMLWNSIEPEWLDRSLEFLRAEGYEPFLLFEGSEEQEFRKRFEGHSPLGGLDWPPVANINRQVRIYDPRDRERYMRGEPVHTDRAWTGNR
jgi:hypothetical protein